MDGDVHTGCRVGQYCSDERCAACLQILPLSVCFPHLEEQWHGPAALFLHTVHYSVCLYTLRELNRFFGAMFWHKSVAEAVSHWVHSDPPTTSLHTTKLCKRRNTPHALISPALTVEIETRHCPLLVRHCQHHFGFIMSSIILWLQQTVKMNFRNNFFLIPVEAWQNTSYIRLVTLMTLTHTARTHTHTRWYLYLCEDFALTPINFSFFCTAKPSL